MIDGIKHTIAAEFKLSSQGFFNNINISDEYFGTWDDALNWLNDKFGINYISDWWWNVRLGFPSTNTLFCGDMIFYDKNNKPIAYWHRNGVLYYHNPL